MDFTFSPEQIALREAVRSFLAAEAPNEYVRRMAEHDDTGVTPRSGARSSTSVGPVCWCRSRGGLGLGLVDAVVVQEEMGRAVFPGPYFSSAILATLAARALGLEDQLEALAAGTQRGPSCSTKPATAIRSITSRCARKVAGSRYKVDGVKPMVPDGLSADWILVPARTREGLQSFLSSVPRRATRRRASTSPASSRR